LAAVLYWNIEGRTLVFEAVNICYEEMAVEDTGDWRTFSV
jgi:hypothetical protein